MTRRRLLLFALAAVCVGGALIAAWLLLPRYQPVDLDLFFQVEDKMTQDEVLKIVAQPPHIVEESGRLKSLSWFTTGDGIYSVHFENQKVYLCTWRKFETPWEVLFCRFGW